MQRYQFIDSKSNWMFGRVPIGLKTILRYQSLKKSLFKYPVALGIPGFANQSDGKKTSYGFLGPSVDAKIKSVRTILNIYALKEIA